MISRHDRVMYLGHLEGRNVICRQDPLYGAIGWTLPTGNPITEMQYLHGWVGQALKGEPGTPGDRGIIRNGQLVRDGEPEQLGLGDPT